MITAKEWEEIRAERVGAVHARLLALPKPYQEWVIRTANSRGLPTLRQRVLLGPGQHAVYDALVAQCERELKTRADQGEK